jgi:hypothetical protein
MIRDMRGMMSVTREMSDRVQAGCANPLDRTPGFGAVSVPEEVAG